MKKLVICGNYGATNIGDEAILAGILRLIDRQFSPRSTSGPEVTVLSANPQNTEALHSVKSLPLLPAGPRSFLRGLFRGTIFKTLDAIRTCDGFILGGGGLFNDEKPLSIMIWGLQAKFALLFRKPIFCLGQSVGPLNNFFSRFIVKSIYSRARAVTVRDSYSQSVIHSLGLPLPRISPDPAFSLHAPEPPSSERENFIVVSLRDWHKNMPSGLDEAFAAFINAVFKEHGLKTVLVPFSSAPENDTAFLEKISDQVRDKNAVSVLEYTNDFHKMLEVVSRAKAVVGMRLHSLIFATMTLTPFIALSYSKKVLYYAAGSDMERFTVALEDVSSEKLSEKFNILMRDYDHVKGMLVEQNLIKRDTARVNAETMKLFVDSL